MSRIGANIEVNGIVQGVGFRPFIHKQITDHSLCGFIRNTSQGVEIAIEGEEDRVRQFIDELWTRAPALAVVREVSPHFYTDLKNYSDFRILSSQALPERNTLISPDVALCPDCRRELFDPSNRRYRYPFINCTNCGPRYTIVKDVPYDRPKTSMGRFPLCGPCDREYHDIEDRRYHAQPVCCRDCGPRLLYYNEESTLLSACGDAQEDSEKALRLAKDLLKKGGILAVKGLGGIHLACRIDDPSVSQKLRLRKGREEKPFALMARDTDLVRLVAELSPSEEVLLKGRERPIVLLKKKDPSSFLYLSENDRLGIMLPYTPLHELLLEDDPGILVMTSANLSDRPILTGNAEALSGLKGIADGFLLNDRDIVARCDDSLLWVFDGGPYFARRSRGYAPRPVSLDGPGQKGPSVLAFGAEQKASFVFLKEENAFLSPHVGDVKDWETFEAYEGGIRHYEKLFGVTLGILACDMHPDYLSTAAAEERARGSDLPLVRVQHHHAHMVSCMAENGISGLTLGIIWDGTGYGTDGTVWGGEFLLGDEKSFTRAASIRPFRLPGGDLCAREIGRTALSLLDDAVKSFPWEKDLFDRAAARLLPPDEERSVRFQLENAVNAPLSSGMGRLFDGVSALLGICRKASYEGQAAMLLEAAAAPDEEGTFPWQVFKENGRRIIDERPLIAGLCKERECGTDKGILAARFMNTLIRAAAETAGRIRKESGVNQTVLSGGCFQNLYLLKNLSALLRREGFTVRHHRRVSCNDEGICLGQAVIARAKAAAFKNP